MYRIVVSSERVIFHVDEYAFVVDTDLSEVFLKICLVTLLGFHSGDGRFCPEHSDSFKTCGAYHMRRNPSFSVWPIRRTGNAGSLLSGIHASLRDRMESFSSSSKSAHYKRR